MTEEKKVETDEALSALLDSALADFGRTRNTDDELDSFMAKLDAEAAEKAAKNFDTLMQKTSQNFGASTSTANDSGEQNAGLSDNGSLTADERKAAENFQNMVRALIQAEEKSRVMQDMETDASELDRAASDELFDRLKNLTERDPSEFLDDSSWLPVMEFAKTIFAKDFMYPTVKQIHSNFLEYMSKQPELDGEIRRNYENQIDVMSRICTAYEKDQSNSSDLMINRAEEICSLIMELQSYGYPPEEVVGSMPAGWSFDQSTGVPHVDDISKAADACSLM